MKINSFLLIVILCRELTAAVPRQHVHRVCGGDAWLEYMVSCAFTTSQV